MTEPVSLAHRCDQCLHCDRMPRVHPMTCRHPAYQQSIACQQARADGGKCGPDAVLWEPIGITWGRAQC